MAELTTILQDYVATAIAPEYNGNWDIIDGKFPELADFDKQLLKDYVATAVSRGYDWNTINSKFPEFFGEIVDKAKKQQEVKSDVPTFTGVGSLTPETGDFGTQTFGIDEKTIGIDREKLNFESKLPKLKGEDVKKGLSYTEKGTAGQLADKINEDWSKYGLVAVPVSEVDGSFKELTITAENGNSQTFNVNYDVYHTKKRGNKIAVEIEDFLKANAVDLKEEEDKTFYQPENLTEDQREKYIDSGLINKEGKLVNTPNKIIKNRSIQEEEIKKKEEEETKGMSEEDKEKYKEEQQIKKTEEARFLMPPISSDLTQLNAKKAGAVLKDKYANYGFDYKRDGNVITVTSPDGDETESFNFNLKGARAKTEALRMDEWMRSRAISRSQIDNIKFHGQDDVDKENEEKARTYAGDKGEMKKVQEHEIFLQKAKEPLNKEASLDIEGIGKYAEDRAQLMVGVFRGEVKNRKAWANKEDGAKGQLVWKNIDGRPVYIEGYEYQDGKKIVKYRKYDYGDDDDFKQKLTDVGISLTGDAKKRKNITETKQIKDNAKRDIAVQELAKEQEIVLSDMSEEERLNYMFSPEVEAKMKTITDDDERVVDEVQKSLNQIVNYESENKVLEKQLKESDKLDGDNWFVKDKAQEVQKQTAAREKLLANVELKNNINKLEQINSNLEEITTELGDINDPESTGRAVDFQKDYEAFEAKADKFHKDLNSGAITSEAEFDRRKNELVRESERLEVERLYINKQIDRLDSMLEVRPDIIAKAEELAKTEEEFGAYLDIVQRNHNFLPTLGVKLEQSIGRTFVVGGIKATTFLKDAFLRIDGQENYEDFIELVERLGVDYETGELKNDLNGNMKGMFGKALYKYRNTFTPTAITGETAKWKTKMLENWEKYSKERSASVGYGKTWGDLNGVFDYVAFGVQGLVDFAPQLALLATAGPYGLAYMALQSTGEKYESVVKEKQEFEKTNGMYGHDYTWNEMLFNASTTGLFEYASEKVTLGLIKKTANQIKNIPKARAGYLRALKDNIFNWRTFKSGLYGGTSTSVQEGFSEAVAALGDNFADIATGVNKSIWENVPEMAFTGAFIGGAMKVPVLGKTMLRSFQQQTNIDQYTDNAYRISELQHMLSQPGVTAENVEAYTQEVAELTHENNLLLQIDIKRLDMMEEQEKQELVFIDKDQTKLRQRYQDIKKDKSKSDRVKERELNKISEKFNKNQDRKEDILAKYPAQDVLKRYGDFKKQFEDRIKELGDAGAKIKWNTGKSKDMTNWLKGDLGKEDDALIQGQIDSDNAIIADPNSTSKQVKDAKARLDGYKQFKKDDFTFWSRIGRRYGAMTVLPDGTIDIFINEETSLRDGIVTTGAHEFFHGLIYATIKADPAVQEAFGNALMEEIEEGLTNGFITEKPNSNFRQRIEVYKRNPEQGEEVMAIISEAIIEGDLKFKDDTSISRLQKQITDYSRDLLKTKKSDPAPIRFDSSKDVLDFVKNYSLTIKNKKKFNKAMVDLFIKGAEGKLIDEARTKEVKGKKFFSKSQLQNKLTEFKAEPTKDDMGEFLMDMGLPEFKKQTGAIVESITKRLFDPIPSDAMDAIPGDTRFKKREAYKNRLITTAATLVTQEFDPAKQDLDKFISTRLSLRANKLAEQMGVSSVITKDIADIKETDVEGMLQEAQKEFEDLETRDIAAEQLAEAKARKKAKEEGKKFKKKKKKELPTFLESTKTPVNIVNKVNRIGKNANIQLKDPKTGKVVSYKDFKKLVKSKNAPLREIGNIVSDQFGVPFIKIINDADLTADQRNNARDYIKKQVKQILEMFPEGDTAGGKSAGVNTVLLNAKNPDTGKQDLLYKDGERVTYKKTGSAQGKPAKIKQNIKDINVQHFLSFIGINPDGTYKKGTSHDSAIRAIISQATLLTANQSVRKAKTGLDPIDVIQRSGDGKTILMFSKTNKGESINDGSIPQEVFDVTVDLMKNQPELRDKPQALMDTVFEVFNANGLDISRQDLNNFQTYLEERLSDIRKTPITTETFEKINDNFVERNIVYTDSWSKFLNVSELNQYKTLDKKNPDDVAFFKEQTLKFLSKLPTSVLKNTMMIKASLQTGASTDMFTVKQIDSMVDSIIKARENTDWVEPKLNFDITKVGFDSNMMKKLEAVMDKYGERASKGDAKALNAIQKESRAIFNKSKVDPVETKKALKFLLLELNSHLNEKNINKKEKTNRGNFIISLLQQQTNFTSGIFRGAANFNSMSFLAGQKNFKRVSKKKRLGVAKKYGIFENAPNAKLFGSFLAGSKLTNKQKSEIEPIVNRKLKAWIKKNNSNLTLEQLKQIEFDNINEIKTRHGEHDLALFSMTSNVFQSMNENTLNLDIDPLIKYYNQTGLNEDVRKIVDDVLGRTGTAGNYKIGMNANVRFIEAGVDPNTIFDYDYNTTVAGAIYGDLLLTETQDKGYNDITSSIKESLGKDIDIIRKNKNLIKTSPDVKYSFSKAVTETVDEIKNNLDPIKSKAATIDLVDTIKNIDDINKTRKKISDASILINEDLSLKEQIENQNIIKNAFRFSKPITEGSKGISILDFDDTLATTKSSVRFTKPDGTKGKLNAKEYARDYVKLAAEGYTFDFSEFKKVVKGKPAPLLNKALKLSKKFGTDNMFVLTARPAESQQAIHEFLKANGLNIPVQNITGLGNSTAEAKALWVADKVTEGYNDFYFADDALPNVQAVDNILEQFDVKRKVQQAKLNFSKQIPRDLDAILEETPVDLDADFNAMIGDGKKSMNFVIPPSAQDLEGLIYSFLGKGKEGERHHKWFKDNLFDPFAKGVRKLNIARQSTSENFRDLKRKSPKVRKMLKKTVPGTDFTYEQAVRVYNWDKSGFDIPNLDDADKTKLIEAVENNSDLINFSEKLSVIFDQASGLVEPDNSWLAGTISFDIFDALQEARGVFLKQWKENSEIIFSPENLKKIKAKYGDAFVSALQDILYRMETGNNRAVSQYKRVNYFFDWVNGSIGATMFINIRSATLQTLSTVNFINWHDNNPLKAGTALANVPQFTKDFMMIFNSPFLKQRRSGIQHDINANEMMKAIQGSKNPARAAIGYLLQKGFKPTQIMDSFAIASGGATFYRNRVNTYLKQGLSQKDAEARAFVDMQEIAESSQQSSRPDRVSQQQASPLGKLILAFQNTPMQYVRIMNKAGRDLAAGRGDARAHISKIIYYGAVQNVIFYGFQSALFAVAFGDDDDEKLTDEELAKKQKAEDKKKMYVVNGMMDTILRGSGITGAVISTTKNMILEYIEQRNKPAFVRDHAYTMIEGLNLSPPIGIKARKFYGGLSRLDYDEDIIKYMSKTDLDNPMYSSIFGVTEAITNIPLSRAYNKINNIRDAFDSDNKTWQRVALLLGWSRWSLGMGKKQEILDIENEISEIKKLETKRKREEKKKIKKLEQEVEDLALENQFREDQKKEREEGKKDVTCVAVNKNGERCGVKAVGGGRYCTIHQKVEKRTDGKKVQCKKIKGDGKRCKMQTNNKSGLCYYHD